MSTFDEQLPYRCPFCVEMGVTSCPHGLGNPLDQTGEPLNGREFKEYVLKGRQA